MSLRFTILICALLALLLVAPSAHAAPPHCTVSTSVTGTLGTYSPAAVKAGAVPALQARAGLNCPVALLTLLAGNFTKAKFTSTNNFKLIRDGGTDQIAYTASADAAGTVAFTQNATVDYMQNNLLNLLGLLGGTSADLPIFVKPTAPVTLMPAGTYKDRITIHWDWHQCTGIGLLGACVGDLDEGTGTSVVDVVLTVTPQNITLSITQATTWDALNGTLNPKSLPGSRRRTTIAVANPDIVAVDAGSLALVLPTPTRTSVALDGDGVNSTAVTFAEGSPASGVAFRYGGATDATDDVDFSADGGTSWALQPTLATAATITHIRIRPRNAMAKQSAFNLTIAYRLR